MTSSVHTLRDTSLSVILAGQTPEGAYLAAPTFSTYRYSWFRDGAFIAKAMDDWGEQESAAAFHDWVIRTLEKQLPHLRVSADQPLRPEHTLHTRYLPDGTTGTEDWPNFQLDGFGTWLWAYQRHLERTGRAPSPQTKEVVRSLADYLTALWPRPNYDCWEEHADKVHPSTLGALYAGLTAAAELLSLPYYHGVAEAVRSYLLTWGVKNGHFTKHVGTSAVDANLLWLAVPYKVVPADHEIARATAAKIRADLQDPDGGVHRYQKDTYYGGGSWILLTAALAQDHLAIGEVDEARKLRFWIEAQVTPEGYLPEQVSHHLNDPAYLPEWEERWGNSACPLLWSHAAYLSLIKRLEEIA